MAYLDQGVHAGGASAAELLAGKVRRRIRACRKLPTRSWPTPCALSRLALFMHGAPLSWPSA